MLFKSADRAPSIGLFGLQEQPTMQREGLARVARLSEDLGYESLWLGEHPVLPDPPTPDSPFDPRLRLGDPLVALSYLAAVTERIRLATGVLLLPLRNPVVLAKQLASLDVLSGGRLIVGFGMGYIAPEAAAVGVPFDDRAARGQEHLEAMRALWYEQAPAYHGRYVDFDHVDAHPRPLQPELPIVAGGYSAGAYRRAVTMAHGWYGFFLRPEKVARHLQGLRAAAERHPRPDGLGPLEITVTPPTGMVSPELAEEYRRAGVHRLVVYPGLRDDLEAREAFVRKQAAVLGLGG